MNIILIFDCQSRLLKGFESYVENKIKSQVTANFLSTICQLARKKDDYD